MAVEDAQWMDPSTGELLDAIVEAVSTRAGLVVVTHRPDFEVPWSSRGNLTRVPLARLGRERLKRPPSPGGSPCP